MFTGIIQAVGEVAAMETRGGDMRLRIRTGSLPLGDVALGDSISTNGVCLTVVELPGDGYWADVSVETLNFTTLGDLKLVERPQPMLLGPMDFCSIKANVKVTSTENGIIFGNIVYDCGGVSSDRNVVVLNDIHIDIMDYIVPAACTETEFRQMWAEFEWENKVTKLCPCPLSRL